jgi:hypothetical protein
MTAYLEAFVGDVVEDDLNSWDVLIDASAEGGGKKLAKKARDTVARSVRGGNSIQVVDSSHFGEPFTQFIIA